MTQQQIDQQMEAMVINHVAKMQGISDRGLQNATKWGSVTATLAERFVDTGKKVTELLDAEKVAGEIQ